MKPPWEWHWLFIKEKTNQYLILKDDEVTGEIRWMLRRDGYELIWDSAHSYQAAATEAKTFYSAKQLKLQVIPITLKEATVFVNNYHRHHLPPQGHKFSIALFDGDLVVGVAIAGRPVSRHQDDGFTLEITRCCVKEAYKNGISILYSSVCQIAKRMGYKQVITYTLAEESGVSLKASNFIFLRQTEGGTWNSKKRARIDKHPTGAKCLWSRTIN